MPTLTPEDAWRAHVQFCAKCSTVDANKPATLAAACLVGSSLFKDAANYAWLKRKDRAAS